MDEKEISFFDVKKPEIIKPPTLEIPKTIDRLDQLLTIEDEIAAAIFSDIHLVEGQTYDWQCRENIVGLITPPHFQGKITNIQITEMEQSFERLKDVKSREMRFLKKFDLSSHRLSNQVFVEMAEQSCHGLIISATAESKGRGYCEPFAAEIWLTPSSTKITKRTFSPNRTGVSTSNERGGICRYIARPVEQDRFRKHHKQAKRKLGMTSIASWRGQANPRKNTK